MTKQNMMINAHKLAKRFTGNYGARLALALRIIWRRIKASDKFVYIKSWIIKKNEMSKQINELTIANQRYADEVWRVKKETDKALLVEPETSATQKQYWIPKSQCLDY